MMRITFKTDGGLAFFPGLAQPFVFDSSQLEKRDAKTLQRLIDKAEFFELPTMIGQTLQGAADMQTQTLTIEDGAKSKTVKLVSDASEDVQALFDGVQEIVTKLRAKQ
jgi:uncharacterized membrane-anchored protein